MWWMSGVICAVFVVRAQAQLIGSNRPQTISNIFQIPIQTLTAVSNVAQNTRPLGEIFQQRPHRFRPENMMQQQQQHTQQQYQSPLQSVYRPQQYQQSFQSSFNSVQSYISRAARVAGLYTAADGSGFRI